MYQIIGYPTWYTDSFVEHIGLVFDNELPIKKRIMLADRETKEVVAVLLSLDEYERLKGFLLDDGHYAGHA